MKTVTLTVEGMHCDGCASNVQSLLGRQNGIKKASVSYQDKEARALYDPQVITEDQLVSIIERGGYQVTSRVHG